MSAQILLDTCTSIWVMENKPMKPDAIAAIDAATAAGGRVFVSPITGWEVGMLASKGRFRSPHTPQRWLELLLALPNVALAAMPP